MAKRSEKSVAPPPAPVAAPEPVATANANPESTDYTVLARRYRPQQFGELVGQNPVARALMNAIKAGRVAHAYLFTGARGVGKTSTARILAKALNCVEGPTPTPCDKCNNCINIASGEDIDVLEIDGASNRGIDEVRAIRQNVGTRPSRSRFKIYIIDEVHMLTTQAFNALLKTLEEPPPHVKFIFATTEVQKIPITILSRCQRFDFTGISSSKIVDRLRQVVESEGMQADDAALQLVARRAGGSMRDAQSLLDQLLAFGDKHLTAEQVHQLLGTAADDRILKLADLILTKDCKSALQMVQDCADEGLQLGEVLDQLIEYWRTLMLVHTAGLEIAEAQIAESHRLIVQKQVQSINLDTILAGLDILTTTKSRMKFTSHPQILVEMAVIRLSRLDELVPLVQLTELLTNPNALAGKSLPIPGTGAANSDPAKKNSKSDPNLSKSEPKSVETGGKTAQNSEQKITFEQIWQATIQELGGILGSHLEKVELPAISGPKALVIRIPSRYTAAYDYVSGSGNLARIEATLKQISGEGWTVRVEKEISNGKAHVPIEAEPLSRKDREKELLQLPMMQKIVDMLGGRLLNFDDGFGSLVPTTTTDEPDLTPSDDTEEN